MYAQQCLEVDTQTHSNYVVEPLFAFDPGQLVATCSTNGRKQNHFALLVATTSAGQCAETDLKINPVNGDYRQDDLLSHRYIIAVTL